MVADDTSVRRMNRPWTIHWAAALVAALTTATLAVTAAPALASDDTAIVTGTVTDAPGEPAAGVTGRRFAVGGNVKTAADGTYRLETRATSGAVIEFSADGIFQYAPRKVTLETAGSYDLEPGQVLPLDEQL